MARINSAAASEFKSNGFHATTTAAVARAADVTEAQIFRYYDSKLALFKSAVFEPLVNELQSFAATHAWTFPELKSGVEYRHDQIEYVNSLQRFFQNNLDYIVSVYFNNVSTPEEGNRPVESLNAYFRNGASIIERRQKGKSKIRPELLARVSFAAVLGCVMFKDWIFPQGLAKDEEIRHAISDFVIDGVNASEEPTTDTGREKPRKRRSTHELMDRIHSAAVKEFKNNGFDGATTAVIAREADVTEAQIFRYYKSKIDLFKCAVFDPLERELNAFARMHDWADIKRHIPQNHKTEQIKYVDYLQNFCRNNMRYIISLYSFNMFNDKYHNLPSRPILSLVNYFDRGTSILKSRQSKEPRMRPELMVRVSFAAVLGCVMFNDWLFPSGLAEEDEIRQAIDDFVLDGVNAT